MFNCISILCERQKETDRQRHRPTEIDKERERGGGEGGERGEEEIGWTRDRGREGELGRSGQRNL